MTARYEFTVYRSSWQELLDEANEMAERMFGYLPPPEAFVRFEVRDYASAFGAQPGIYQADVTVEMHLS